MNWQHIVYFCTAARTENFRKAADELFVSVSALSKAISSLEEELEVPLFVKSGRNVFLTKYGETFYEYARQAMDSIDQGRAAMKSMSECENGSVVISGIQTMCAQFLPEMIRGFAQLHPQIRITLGSAICLDILEKILENTADLGFCSDFDANEKKYADIERVLLKKEEFTVVVAKDHRFAKQQDISLNDLAGERIIVPQNPRSRNRVAFEEIFRETTQRPAIAYELPDDSSIMGMVGAGMGISVMADISSMHREDLVSVPIRDLDRAQNQYLVWRKSRKLSPAIILFRDYVIKEI